MDILTFIAEMTNAIAWPVAILILGLAFRKQVAGLLPFMNKIKAGPLEAEFDLEAKSILLDSKEIAAKISNEKSPKISLESERSDVELAKIFTSDKNPKEMVLDGWRNIDGALWRIGKDAGIIVDPMQNTDRVYLTVISTNALSNDTKKLVVELYELRNRVAHANISLSLDAARDYLLAIEQAVKLIEKERETVEKIGNAKY